MPPIGSRTFEKNWISDQWIRILIPVKMIRRIVIYMGDLTPITPYHVHSYTSLGPNDVSEVFPWFLRSHHPPDSNPNLGYFGRKDTKSIKINHKIVKNVDLDPN